MDVLVHAGSVGANSAAQNVRVANGKSMCACDLGTGQWPMSGQGAQMCITHSTQKFPHNIGMWGVTKCNGRRTGFPFANHSISILRGGPVPNPSLQEKFSATAI